VKVFEALAAKSPQSMALITTPSFALTSMRPVEKKGTRITPSVVLVAD
jgi:hypothetical protein